MQYGALGLNVVLLAVLHNLSVHDEHYEPILFNAALKKINATVHPTLLGSGMKALAMEDGRCVNTIVLIRPKYFARGPANMADTAHRNCAADVMSPSVALER